MPKPPWAQVKLRVVYGQVPEFSDELRVTSTGRRYQVIGVRGRALTCLVLPADAPTEPGTRVWDWQWAGRKKRAVNDRAC
jgi:hypothetical protein